MNVSVIEKVLFAYLENHPEVIEKLIAALIDRLVERLHPQEQKA